MKFEFKTIQVAKHRIIRDFPIFAHILFKYPVIIDETIPACAGIKGGKIRINPIEINSNLELFGNILTFRPSNEEELKLAYEYICEYLIFHEIKHLILNHLERGKNLIVDEKDEMLWNLASDYVVEYTNRKESLPNLYDVALRIIAFATQYEYPEDLEYDLKVKTAESVFNFLKKFKEKVDFNRLKLITILECGKGEIDIPCEVLLGEYVKLIGKSPGYGLPEEYDVLLTKFNIIQYIRNVIGTCLQRVDAMLKIPHRRQVALSLPVLIEQLKFKRGNKILTAIDVSGSITTEEFEVFLSGVLNATREHTLDIILWDTKVREEYYDVNEKEVLGKEIKLAYRGGTNLNSVVQFIRDRYYDNLIILTDGLCDFNITEWRELKHKPSTILFHTYPGLSFTPPKEWDIHHISTSELIKTARILNYGGVK